MEDKDLYAALGVERGASDDDIRRAYRKLARKHHPDVNPGNDEAEERFKVISEAGDVLGDPAKRKLYDEFGMAGVQAGFDPQQARAARSAHSWGSGGFERRSGFGGYQNYEDIFGDIFGQGGGMGAGMSGGPRGSARAAAGGDFESELEIGLLDAIRGLSTEISIERREPCSVCSGSGLDLSSARTCSECGGQGRTRVGDGPVAFMRACPRCGGLGQEGAKPCGACGGSGTTTRRERLSVKIPPGVDTGSRVRVAGKGGAGTGGAPAGDLYIVITVRPHPLVERRGDDLYIDLPVTVPEAIVGASIEVPTPDGSKVRVRVPAGTQSGARLRVRGHGMPPLKGGARGDLILRVQVHIPKDGGEPVVAAAKALEAGYQGDLRAALRY